LNSGLEHADLITAAVTYCLEPKHSSQAAYFSMTTETAEIMVHPVLDENRLLSNIGHLEKNILHSNGGPLMLIERCLIWEI